jgi:hypothetical protein
MEEISSSLPIIQTSTTTGKRIWERRTTKIDSMIAMKPSHNGWYKPAAQSRVASVLVIAIPALSLSSL